MNFGFLNREGAKTRRLQFPSPRRKPGSREIVDWIPAFAGMTTLFIFLVFAFPARADDVFDRVMKTGTIKCAYYVFTPVTERDPETGELTGLLVDYMEEIGRRANLRIEWAEEVTFGNWAPALQADRFDAVCTPMWPEIPMARAVAFTEPLFFAGLSPLVRADDPRFQSDNEAENFARLNQPDVTFIAQEGNAQEPLTRAAFPEATVRTISAAIEGPVVLQEIVTGKADAILLDRNAEITYNRNNDVKLRLIAPEKPVKVQPFTLVVRKEAMIWKDFLDNAIRELHNDGMLERMMRRWEPEPYTFLRPAVPYAKPYEE